MSETYLAGIKRSVDTGDTYFNELAKSTISGRKLAIRFLDRNKIRKLEIYNGKPLKARIEYAKFLVDCPNCNSAEFAFEDGLFYCSQCFNSDIQGKARRVIMPKQRKEIENILLKRPIKNRHWFPSEKLEDLEKENLKMEVK